MEVINMFQPFTTIVVACSILSGQMRNTHGLPEILFTEIGQQPDFFCTKRYENICSALSDHLNQQRDYLEHNAREHCEGIHSPAFGIVTYFPSKCIEDTTLYLDDKAPRGDRANKHIVLSDFTYFISQDIWHKNSDGDLLTRISSRIDVSGRITTLIRQSEAGFADTEARVRRCFAIPESCKNLHNSPLLMCDITGFYPHAPSFCSLGCDYPSIDDCSPEGQRNLSSKRNQSIGEYEKIILETCEKMPNNIVLAKMKYLARDMWGMLPGR